jgi:predicted phosphoribosyltransferase
MHIMFRDRHEAAERLACRLRLRVLHDPLVLTIPRGAVLGAALAELLQADLDLILSARLRAPGRPDVALGALAEDGTVYLDPLVRDWPEGIRSYLEVEKRLQADEVARRKKLFRAVRPAAAVAGRTAIVTDYGIATGSTMLAALDVVRGQRPRELIVAVPVCAAGRVDLVRRCCDDLVYLECPEEPATLRRCCAVFPKVSDEEVRDLLHRFAPGVRAEPVETA